MSNKLRDARKLLLHIIRVWRGGQLRFRLETFGLYHPALPYSRDWWRLSPRGLYLLLRQTVSYTQWVVEMEKLRESGARGWWERHGGVPGEPPQD